MSDLISRGDVINLLCILHIDNVTVNGKRVTEYIRELPTAYDVDKVVAELEEMRNEDDQGCKRVQGWKCHSYSDCGLCIMDRTIKIVKAGGKNEID